MVIHESNTNDIIAFITGANTGIGFGIAYRLLQLAYHGITIDRHGFSSITTTNRPNVTLILGCRDPNRATMAKSRLLSQFPNACIHIILLDLSVPDSCITASQLILKQFPRITHFFCNAGCMPTIGLSWSAIFRDLIFDPIDLFTLGTNAFVQPRGYINNNCVGSIFMANTASHYLLIKSLLPSLIAGQARVIFTSSKTGMRHYFNPLDIDCRHGFHPYQSSKYALDALSLGLTNRYSKHGISFHSFCPGTVYTGIIAIPLPSIMVLGLYYLIRLMNSCMTITPHHGATAALHLAIHSLPDVNHVPIKTLSRVTSFGSSYIERIPLTIATHTGNLNTLINDGHTVMDHCDHIFSSLVSPGEISSTSISHHNT